MARRKMTKIGFKTNLIMEVIGASLLVQKLPALLNNLVFSNSPLTGMTATLAGVGGTYLLSSFFKKPDMANAGIALGVVEVVSPMLDDLLGAGSPIALLPTGAPTATKYGAPVMVKSAEMADFVTLNDYVPNAGSAMSYQNYRNNYENY